MARGACMVRGLCGQGACMMKGEACMVCMPPPPSPPQDTAGQCAGGTYPTGMHSCYFGILFQKAKQSNVIRF